MYSVFINDKPLRFINTYDKGELEQAKGNLIFSEHDKSIDEIISHLEKTHDADGVFYLSENPASSWNIFLSHYSLVEAAGGLVQNRKGEILVIFRLNKWDLPKGKIEYDETPEQAAIREVQEECGIGELSIVQKLSLTFHTYSLNRKRKLKKTHWFLMRTEHAGVLIPQTEEDILEARWMNEKEIQSKMLANTYASIAGLLRSFLKKH